MKFINDYGKKEGQDEIDEERALFLIGGCYNKANEMLEELKSERILALQLMGSTLTVKKEN